MIVRLTPGSDPNFAIFFRINPVSPEAQMATGRPCAVETPRWAAVSIPHAILLNLMSPRAAESQHGRCAMPTRKRGMRNYNNGNINIINNLYISSQVTYKG